MILSKKIVYNDMNYYLSYYDNISLLKINVIYNNFIYEALLIDKMFVNNTIVRNSKILHHLLLENFNKPQKDIKINTQINEHFILFELHISYYHSKDNFTFEIHKLNDEYANDILLLNNHKLEINNEIPLYYEIHLNKDYMINNYYENINSKIFILSNVKYKLKIIHRKININKNNYSVYCFIFIAKNNLQTKVGYLKTNVDNIENLNLECIHHLNNIEHFECDASITKLLNFKHLLNNHRLKRIYIENCDKLESIDELIHFKELEYLTLNNCNISIELIKSNLNGLKNLKKLIINNRIILNKK